MAVVRWVVGAVPTICCSKNERACGSANRGPATSKATLPGGPDVCWALTMAISRRSCSSLSYSSSTRCSSSDRGSRGSGASSTSTSTVGGSWEVSMAQGPSLWRRRQASSPFRDQGLGKGGEPADRSKGRHDAGLSPCPNFSYGPEEALPEADRQ